MQLAEIQIIKADPQSPIIITDAYELNPYIVINNVVALKVERISNSYDTSAPVPITLNSDVNGYLIFTKEQKEYSIAAMTEYEFISFLSIADYSDYGNSTFQFETDFLIVNEDFFLDYLQDYHSTSMLWGGFAHSLHNGTPTARYKHNISKIELDHKLKTFDSYSYESCIRALEQPYAFERFLKLYHLLELEFDYSVIKKIQTLSIPSDANKIGKILNEYSGNEVPRLTDLIENSCTDIGRLEQKLANVSLFPTIAEDLFINFGKSKNEIHLINIAKFRAVVTSGSFSSANLISHKAHSATDHNKFIINLTAYWIYRIRCSIAHNKIGEYLLSWNDERFIVDFGEPLLKEVLMQYFKK